MNKKGGDRQRICLNLETRDNLPRISKQESIDLIADNYQERDYYRKIEREIQLLENGFDLTESSAEERLFQAILGYPEKGAVEYYEFEMERERQNRNRLATLYQIREMQKHRSDYSYPSKKIHDGYKFLKKHERYESDIAFYDSETMRQLVEGNIYLVKETVDGILMRHESELFEFSYNELSEFSHDDLFQEGCLGLMHAVHHFRPDQPKDKVYHVEKLFSEYVKSCVKSIVLDYMRKEKKRINPKVDSEITTLLRKYSDNNNPGTYDWDVFLKYIDSLGDFEKDLVKLKNRPPSDSNEVQINSSQETARYLGFMAVLDKLMIKSEFDANRDDSLLTIDEIEVTSRYFDENWQRGATSQQAIATELGFSLSQIKQILKRARQKMLARLSIDSDFNL